MGKGTKKSKKSEPLDKLTKKCTEVNPVANVNTNHAAAQSGKRLMKTADKSNVKPRLRSKVVVVTEKTQFEEEGDIVVMEVTDTATAEFASEDDQAETTQDSPDFEESKVESDEESDLELANESGEIVTQSEEEAEVNTSQTDEDNEEHLEPAKAKKKKRSFNSEHLERRLDTMSSTLLAMKELIVKSSLALK